MKRSATTGLVLAAVLSVAALTAFLARGRLGESLLLLVCAAFPAALYLLAPGPRRSGRRRPVFPMVLGAVLLAGLSGVVLLSASGRGADGLIWLILSLWLLPLILVSAYHAATDREEDH
jgi:FtsH-binding integral membrane protein